jgi:hypothetical protein
VVSDPSGEPEERRKFDSCDMPSVLAAARQWSQARNVTMKVTYLSLTGKHYVSWTWDRDQINYACEFLSELGACILDGCLNVELRMRREVAPRGMRWWKPTWPTGNQTN